MNMTKIENVFEHRADQAYAQSGQDESGQTE